MVRLTVDLIQHSLSYLNPLKERELDLRGHRIPTIENLGVAGPQDAIDFTDNDIQILGNFPLSPRIRTLLLARNRVASIQPTLPSSIPNLTNLVLASNQLTELADLDVLGKFVRLTQLVLMDNPVTKKEHYRYWVVWRCPTVRFLDYQKVKQAERDKAAELFGTAEEPTELASKIMGIRSTGFNAAAANGAAAPRSRMKRLKLTDKEKQRLQERIKKAGSLEEIIRLEKDLEEGRLPPGILSEDAMEE
ncbi:L domain-like protein [Cryphonectria parasitica EP155]|uniref:U2 small nuclear ribonucleoprotein A' n=1 Tax=Cryphonectria parasitica (strain ATCC 38755 / EP155) TaxID=660469 RepID=A0A9P4Y788_CRYP1|nr:L domain-like protein [Cryphonectria parasitica EP155]KAF3767770.1 L domain-like protein [Cryphonectria parasitica EP155]